MTVQPMAADTTGMALTPPYPDSRKRDSLIVLAVAAVVAATVAIGALAPAARQDPRPAGALDVQPDNDPLCAEWGDGCRVCKRLPDGPGCSLPGIACTPGEQKCLRRAAGP